MECFGLILRNIWSRKARSAGLATAVAIAVMTVVTLAVTSSGLEQSATTILSVGKADFTVVEKSAADVLTSTIDERELTRIATTQGVTSAIGVLVEREHLNTENPVFIEIGINPSDLVAFGVKIVAGSPYTANATNEIMLGWRTASNFGLHVGDPFYAIGRSNTITAIYSTGNSFGDAGAMFPLPTLQAHNRVPGLVTLVFAKVQPGVSVTGVTKRIEHSMPQLTTIRTATQFGRADVGLVYLHAAVNGSTVLAVLIGAVIVGNTMLLTLFERTREFGLLRALGWSRRRTASLLVGESLLLAFVGAVIGVALSFFIAHGLAHLPALKGVLQPDFTPAAFWRALLTALAMTLLGAIYPTMRAAFLSPLEALSHE